MTDDPDNVIDFSKARLRKEGSKPAKPVPPPALKGSSHEEICEWIKAYMGADEAADEPEDPK